MSSRVVFFKITAGYVNHTAEHLKWRKASVLHGVHRKASVEKVGFVQLVSSISFLYTHTRSSTGIPFRVSVTQIYQWVGGYHIIFQQNRQNCLMILFYPHPIHTKKKVLHWFLATYNTKNIFVQPNGFAAVGMHVDINLNKEGFMEIKRKENTMIAPWVLGNTNWKYSRTIYSRWRSWVNGGLCSTGTSDMDLSSETSVVRKSWISLQDKTLRGIKSYLDRRHLTGRISPPPAAALR